MPDLIPGSGFEELLNQVAVPGNNLISSQGFAATPNPQAIFENEFRKSMQTKQNLNTPEFVSPFSVDPGKRFPLQVIGMDNEDIYAQGQSGWSKAWNATLKGGVIAATTLAQGTIGLVNGVFQAVNDGKFSSFYDNDMNRSLDNINKSLEDQLPNYYSQSERNNPWYTNIFTTNFIFDKIVKNLGFMAGASIAGNVFSKLLQMGKMSATGNMLKALEATEKAVAKGKPLDTLGDTASGLNSFMKGYNALNTGQRFAVAGLATVGEAGMEAIQATDETRRKLLEDFRVQNGRDAQGDELQRINNTASNVGNSTFLLNTVLLTASNYVQFPKLLASSNRAEKGMFAELVKKAKNVGFDKNTLKYIEQTSKNKFVKLFKGIQPYGPSLSEGLEESGQYAIQTGTENYWNKKYKQGDEINGGLLESLSGIFSPEAVDDLFGFGFHEGFQTKEGQEQFAIGSISGTLGKASGTRREQRESRAYTQALIESSNRSNLSSYTKDSMEALARGADLAASKDDALRQGDVLEYKDLERDFMINYLFPKIKHGRMDLVQDEIDTYKQQAVTPEGFKQLQDQGRALPTDTREAFLLRLDNLQRVAHSTELAYNTLQTRNAFYTKTDKEGKVTPKYSDEVTGKMIYANSKIQDYDERIAALTTNLSSASVDMSVLEKQNMDSLLNNPEEFDRYAKQIQDLQTVYGKSATEDIKNTLNQDLRDVVELSLRRKQFIEEYNDISANPDKYENKPLAPVTATKETVQVKTKDGDEEIEIGTEYFLGKVTKETEQGFLHEKYPILTVLAKNEDGTLKIKDGNGNISNISPDVLKGYKLGKVSDVKNNPKAMFYMKNKDRIFEFKLKAGEKVKGVLRWSPKGDELFFEYMKNGKPRQFPVRNEDFSYKLAKSKGFKEPRLVATNATLTDIQAADELGDKEDKLNAKLAKRMSLISSFVTNARKRLDSMDKFISEKKSELKDVEDALENLSKTKQGVPRKKYTKAITKTLQSLGETKGRLVNEINNLTDEKEELEAVLPYYEDLLANVRELPEDTLELVKELKDEVNALVEVIENTNQAIQTGGELVEKIDEALRRAYSLLDDFIKRLREENPTLPLSLEDYQTKLETYLGEEGAKQFIENNEGYTPLLKSILADIQDFTEELEITPNENKISQLQEQIKDLRGGLVQVVNEQLAKSKILEFFEDRIAEERARQAEEAAIMKNKALQDKIFTSQKQLEALSGDQNGPQSEDQQKQELTKQKNDDQSKKKSATVLFSSTSSPSESNVPDADASPSTVRERNFLFNQTYFSPEVKQNLKGLVVTLNNEASLGLSGLVHSIAKQNTSEGWHQLSDEDLNKVVTDPDNGVVLLVYAIERDGDYIFIDENGKETTPENAIASTLTSTSHTWRKDNISRVRKGDEETAKELSSQWRVRREQYMNSTTPQVVDLAYSRGLPIYNEVDGKIIPVSIVGSLIPEGQVDVIKNHQGAIKVITTDNYTHGDNTYPTIPGRVYFEYEDIFAPLSNRQFNKEEQETLFKALHTLAIQAKDKGTLKGDILTYLMNNLFWGTPSAAKDAGRNQIWIDEDFYLNFGNSGQNIPFTPISIEQNEALIKAYLSGTFNNVNNHTLSNNFHDTFIEYYTENGELKTREHPNYQSYLIDKQLVETPIAPTKSVSTNGNRNFMQKYAIIQGVEYTITKKEEAPKPKPKEEVKPPVPTKVETPGEEWIATSKKSGKKIYYTAVKGEGDVIHLTIDPNKGDYEAIEQSLKDAGKSIEEIDGAFNKLAYEDAKARFESQAPAKEETPAPEVKPSIGLIAPPDDNTEYRQINKLSVERMSDEERADFQQFLKKNLPQFTLREIEHMITMANDRKAWGSLQGKVISVYKLAEKGTGYHEAFEAVWKYFVLPEEQEELLAEFKNRQGTFNDRLTNTKIAYAEANDKQAKEELADEFARYKAGQKLSLGDKIKRFFERIINFFRTFNTGYKINAEKRDLLFDKIESGEFAKRPLPNVLSNTPEYSSVRDLSEAQTHAFVQDITKRVFIELIKEKADLFDPSLYDRSDVYETIKTIYAPSIPTLPNGELTFNELWNRTKDYLRTFNIEFDENNYVTINDEHQTRNDYVNDKMTLDVKKSSPFAIKYILASMAKVEAVSTDGKVKFDKNGTIPGGYQLLPFAKTFITLLEAVEGSTSMDNMIGKLKTLAKNNHNFVPLLNMLGKKGENIDWNNLTTSQWRTLAGFYNTFNKQKPDASFLTYSDTGEVYFSNAEIGKASETIKKQWESNVRFTAKKGLNLFVGYDRKNKNYGINESALKKLQKNIANPDTKIEFLNQIGISFPKESYTKLNKEQRESFNNSVDTMVQYISKNKGLKVITGKSLGISGPLTQLSELYARVNNSQSESTFINGEGEQQQVYVQPNYFSQLSNIFNNIYSLDGLYKALPYLKNDPFAQGSEILKKGGKFFDANGNRTKTKIVLGYTDAIKVEGKGRKIADLDYQQRITTQINNTLEGIYYVGVPADSSTEWSIFLGEFVDYTVALENSRFEEKMQTMMFKYLQGEIALAKDFANHRNLSNVGDKAKDLRFFKDILSSDNLRKVNKAIASNTPLEITESIKEDINRFVKSEVKALRESLLYNEEVVALPKEGQFAYPGLQDNFAERKKINKNNLSENELDALLKYTVANNIVANMEMHKVFFGDPFNFAIKDKGGKVILDETKRIKSFLSPAAPTLVSDNYNNTFNKEFNTIGNTKLVKGIPGFYAVRNTVNTVTFSDVVTQSQYVDEFNKNNEADAQAHHSLQMHRDLLQRHGQWGKKAEDWYKWEMAYTRQELFKKGLFTNYPEALQVNDKGRLKNPKPDYTLHIIKPIVRGVKNGATYLNPVLDKFSSAPLFYSAVKDTNLEKLMVKMMNENIDYVIFESGRKVGAEGKNSFYTESGSFNKAPYSGRLTINWNDYSVQVENSYDKGKSQTRGSQITKLFSLDFFNGGVPIDFQGKNWNSLSEEEKEAQSPVHKEVKWNNTLLSEMTKNGYEQLINKLGMVDTGSNFVITDYKKLYNTLEKEALKRDMPENTKKIFRINPETNLPFIPLEATSEYTKIQKMLYSMVDSSILSPKVNGGPKTQFSVFGWENASKGRSLIIKSDTSKQKEAAESILTKAIEAGKLKDTYIDPTKTPAQEILRSISQQAQNLAADMTPYNDGKEEDSFQRAEEVFGAKLVDAAIAAYPSGQTGNYRKLNAFEYNQLSAEDKKKVRLTSDTLKFYTKDDPYIEVLLPHWFKAMFTKAGFSSDEELLDYLNSTEEGKEILRGVGFRIPTSNMTAIEAIRVKGFLPQEFGDTIVLPTEITTKAGSDFDIDKLNTYLKNVYLDSKNKIKIVPFFGFGESAKKELNKIATQIAVTKESKVVDSLENFEFPDEEEYLADVERLYKQSLENEYYRSLERMITHPLNFDKLTQPTDNDTLTTLASNLADLTGTAESTKLTRLLSINYLSKLRHAFLAGKKWVGIGAVNNTGHSQAQRANQYIDVANTKLSQRDKEVLGNGKIILPHNKDSQGRPTLSGTLDQAKNFISAKLGWYLTAFVDIAKDPYILNIIHSRKIVSTVLFLERLGVNTSTIGYFMNQPIIREYIHYTDVNNINRVASTYHRDKFLETSEFNGKPAENINVAVDRLKKNISDYYVDKKVTSDWKNQQLGILDEFLKYTKMSEHLFMATQATNWDTARFSTGAAVRKKQLLLQKQREQNIIKSPDNILAISNNGKMMDAMILSKEAIDTLSKITSPEIREELNTILDRYINLSYMPETTLEKIDTQIINSFIDYLVQTKKNLNGSTLQYITADATTSIVARVQAMQGTLQLNPIFQNLRTQVSNRDNDADNIRFAPFPKEVYDKNLITGYLQELKEADANPDGSIKKNSLYGDLVKLSILQGTGNQFNLLSYIPMEDISPILQDVVGTVTKEDASNFAKNFNFEKNQWKNSEIVLTVPEIYDRFKFPTKFGPKVLRLSDLFDNKNGLAERPFVLMERYHKLKKSGDRRYDVLTGDKIDRDTIQSTAKNFDFSFTDKVGYQKVYLPNGEPLTLSTSTEEGQTHNYFYYKQVNLLGSNGIQEHYTDQQPSVLENGTAKVVSLTDREIINEVLKINKPQAPAVRTIIKSTSEIQSNKETIKSVAKEAVIYKPLQQAPVITTDIQKAANKYLEKWLNDNELFIDKTVYKGSMDKPTNLVRVTMNNLAEAREAENDDRVLINRRGQYFVDSIINPLTDSIPLKLSDSVSSEFIGFSNMYRDYQEAIRDNDKEYVAAIKKFAANYNIDLDKIPKTKSSLSDEEVQDKLDNCNPF